MNTIYLVSSPINLNKEPNWYLFHFRGYYYGSKIVEVYIYAPNAEFFKNREYVLRLRVESLKGARLITHLLEAKDIKNLSFNF